MRALRYAYYQKSLERTTLVFDQDSLAVTGNPEDDSVEFTIAAITEDDSIAVSMLVTSTTGNLLSESSSGGDGSRSISKGTAPV